MATAAARPGGSRSAQSGRRKSSGPTRAALRERLEARREEIEAAALTRVRAISDPAEVSDPAYAEGLRAAVCAAVDYGIQTTGREGPDPPIPVPLLAQARMAARVGIPLDTVLRRYFAGYSLLGYFILEEAGNAGLTDGDELKRLLGAHAGLFDRLLAAVGEEHGMEREAFPASTERLQAERIERLLAGELIDTAGIAYEFGWWHLGIVGSGPSAKECARQIGRSLDLRPLVVPRKGEGPIWAWLGSRRRVDVSEAMRLAGDLAPDRAQLAFGEPAEGLNGWRLTHRQAAAALPVARRKGISSLRYSDVPLLASAAQDELLETSLRQLYLRPLERERDGGKTAKQTLRAYFAADRNLTATAAALGINRSTVAYRLQAVEEQLERPLGSCMAMLEVALGIDEGFRTPNDAEIRHIAD